MSKLNEEVTAEAKYPDSEYKSPRHFGPKSVGADHRECEWASERRKFGYDSREIWNLDSTLLCFLLPRLKLFRDMANGHPARLESYDEWLDILDRAIADIESVKDDVATTEAHERVSKFLGEYLFDLWW